MPTILDLGRPGTLVLQFMGETNLFIEYKEAISSHIISEIDGRYGETKVELDMRITVEKIYTSKGGTVIDFIKIPVGKGEDVFVRIKNHCASINCSVNPDSVVQKILNVHISLTGFEKQLVLSETDMLRVSL